MKKNTPLKIINYLSIEFFYSLILVFLVFLSLSLLINFVEEMAFFKEKKLDNFILMILYLALCKTPNTMIELSVFIFLFIGILFFVKLQKNKEINTILLSGISKSLPVLVASLISFVFGILIIAALSPLASASLSFYEKTKRIYSSNENLIVINNTGLWFIENLPNGHNIIRADKILDNNFSKLNNVTIYNLDNDFNFLKRFDSKKVLIRNKNWLLESTKILSNENSEETKKKNFESISFVSTININDLKNFFSNANTVSFWNILQNIETLNKRGYSADELVIKYHKYLSLPFYLLSMILLSTVFTLSISKEYNTLIYLFFGLIIGFMLYFLNDLSIAIGVSGKLPLAISVWSPIMLLMLLGIINFIKINET